MARPLKDHDLRKWKYAFHIFVKHALFKKYFIAWSKILGRGFRNLGYMDGFAGRGIYSEMKRQGSPFLALDALTENKGYFDSSLCVFIEKDPDNFKLLTELLESRRQSLSSKIIIETHNREFEEVFPQYLDFMEERPFFVFLDPFGFKGLPLSVVREILTRDKNEVFITLMTRDIRRFLDSNAHQKVLIELLGSKENLIDLNSQEDVAHRYVANLLEFSKYVIHYQVGVDVKSENIYYLIHACNHFKGFKIMKDIMFKQGREVNSLSDV